MLRLTLILSAALYAGLVVYSEGEPASGDQDISVTRAAPLIDATTPVRPRADGQLVTPDGRTLQIAATIDPLALDDGSREVRLVSTFTPETVSTSASAGSPEVFLVEVTGSSVNLRAGPSTNDRVLDALVQGQRAELIASLGNGWAQIRSVETGTEGYMADRFLTPVN